MTTHSFNISYCKTSRISWYRVDQINKSPVVITISLIYRLLTLSSAKAITVPHGIIWSWYTGRWWVGCYIWYSEEGTERCRSLLRPLFAVPNV